MGLFRLLYHRAVLKRRLVLVSAVAVVGLAAAGCSDQNAAIRVGNDTVSQSDFQDELKAYADNEAFWAGLGLDAQEETAGELTDSYSQGFVCQILAQRVQFVLVDQLFEAEGLELTEFDRQAGRQRLESQFNPQVDPVSEFPASYADRLIDDFARIARLESESDQQRLSEAFQSLVDDTDIEVSPRYGTWNTQRWLERDPCPVDPPDGPVSDTPEADEPLEDPFAVPDE